MMYHVLYKIHNHQKRNNEIDDHNPDQDFLRSFWRLGEANMHDKTGQAGGSLI